MAESILIVDDEPDLASAIRFAFEREGWRTAVANDGRAALDSVSLETPALVLLDLMLPDMRGTEVCRALRSSASTRELPIIIYTADDDEESRARGIAAGASEFLTKPFSMRDLTGRVDAWLRGS